MPTIPFTSRRQVAPAADPALSAPVAAFWGGPPPVDFSAVQKQALEMQDHADQMAVDAAELAHSKLATDTMTQATSAQGINALEAARQAQDTYQQESAKIIEGLPNDRVKQLVAHRARGYFDHLYEATESHAAAETKKADAQNITALLNNDLDLVNHDPSTADAAVDKANARVTDYGRRNGWSDAQITEKAGEHTSNIISAALSRMVASEQVDAATAYLEAHRAQLRGGQLDDAVQLVDAATAQNAGMKEADAILGINQASAALPQPEQDQGQQGQPISMAQALAKAEQIADPKARKAATQEIVAHFSHLETAQRLEREAARARMIQKVEQAGGRINRADPDWRTIDGHPEGEHVENRSAQLLKPAKDPGDPDAFMTHLNLASISPASRQEFLNADFTGKDGEGLNTAQRTQLIRLQNSYRGQDTRAGVADQRHDAAKLAQAEQLRFQRETALLKVGDPSHTSTYIEDKAERDKEVARIKAHYDNLAAAQGITPHVAAPSAQTGPVTLGGHVDPAHPYGVAIEPVAAPIQATPAMLAGAARNPAYAEYLRNMGVALPKKLPLPVAEKAKP
jgi:hypothetical protein